MTSPVVRRVLWVRGLRAFGDGFVSLLLPAYLITLGFGPLQGKSGEKRGKLVVLCTKYAVQLCLGRVTCSRMYQKLVGIV